MCYFHDSTHKKRVYSLKIFTKVINFFILRFKGIKLKISYFRRRSAFSYSFPTKNVLFLRTLVPIALFGLKPPSPPFPDPGKGEKCRKILYSCQIKRTQTREPMTSIFNSFDSRNSAFSMSRICHSNSRNMVRFCYIKYGHKQNIFSKIKIMQAVQKL